MNPSQVRTNRAQSFAAGTWGGEFHPEFGPRPGDVVVLEHWAQSGFANTDLDAQLKQRGIVNIILVGMVANTASNPPPALAWSSATMSRSSGTPPRRSATRHARRPRGQWANRPSFAHAILTTKEVLAQLPAPVTA
jgi:hypothetical protein